MNHTRFTYAYVKTHLHTHIFQGVMISVHLLHSVMEIPLLKSLMSCVYVCTCTLHTEPSPQPTSHIYKIILSIFQKLKELSSKSSLRATHCAQEPGVYQRYCMMPPDTAKSATKSLLGQTKADYKRILGCSLWSSSLAMHPKQHQLIKDISTMSMGIISNRLSN